MQPIKTTNAMNPAPAKGIESFPTPVIDDVVISEVVNAWKGDYQPLEYGVLWKDVSHAPNQGSFPEHKLVFQQPTSEDGQWVKRIWVNDRVNQDSYNYAIKYSAGSQEHPIYIRTYIVPRETYAPLLDGTPDPLFPGALLVDEEAQRSEGELDSKYITVTRVYETIPGPEVPTRRYNERGDLETVIVQTVPPNTPPDPDGLLVTGSQVEQVETGKGVKTTSTVQDHALLQIKEKKEGLLGETVTTDDIVDPSTNPDALSQTVVASTVEQYTATKARKRTTTASGPTSLTQKSKDGKLLGDVTATESVVAPNAEPDAVSSTILASEVKQIDSGKAIKRNLALNSTPTLSGRQNEQGLLGIKSTTESIVGAGSPADPLSVSVISSSVEPIDSVRSRKVTVTSTAPTTLVGGQYKEGLLGRTTITESIVAAGTAPDELSESIISSSIEPIDSAKSKKVTISSSRPKKLSSKSLIDSPLGLVNAEIEKTIVPPNTEPQLLTQKNLELVKDQINRIDEFKSEREKVTVDSWPENIGVDYDEQLGIGIYYEETIVSPSEYISPAYWTNISNTDYKPLDQWKSLKRKIDKDKIASALLSQWYRVPVEVNVTLPDKLLGVTMYWGKSYGQGESFNGDFSAATGSYSLNTSGSSKNSYGINGDIYFNLQQGYSGAVSGERHIFFIEIGNDGRVESGEILNILNNFAQFGSRGIPNLSPGSAVELVGTYQRWPYIQMRSENLVVISGGKSESINSSKSKYASINGFGSGSGVGSSIDVDVNARSINIPPSLHGQIKIEEVSFGSTGTSRLEPTYGIFPKTLATTNAVISGKTVNVSQFPIGKYLYSADVELYKWGFVKVTATTVNITAEYV